MPFQENVSHFQLFQANVSNFQLFQADSSLLKPFRICDVLAQNGFLSIALVFTTQQNGHMATFSYSYLARHDIVEVKT